MQIDVSDQVKMRPIVLVTPLVDILFVTLIFVITLLVFQQFETEISISVPRAAESKEVARAPGEIMINVDREGRFVVNQRRLGEKELQEMLKRVSMLYPNQPVIIRADKKTYHESVVTVLNACAAANIWNISFATLKEEKG